MNNNVVEPTNDTTINQPDVQPEEKKPKKKKSKVGIVILVIVLILALLGCAYFFLVANKGNSVDKVENEVKEVASEYRMSGNGLENFDLYFLKIENEAKNKVYSPLSIKYALEMLAEGASGETKKQLDTIIGEYESKKYSNNEHMSFANAIFIRDTFKDAIKETYTTNLSEKYGAEVINDTFTNASNLNSWINRKTLNLIDKLFEDTDIQSLNFVLANALAIDMNWKNRIQASDAPLPEGMDQIVYGVDYRHENYSDNVPFIIGGQYPSLNFNGVDNIKAVEVAASFNRYDIINDKGEDNIRQIVTEDYQKYLDEHPEEVAICTPVQEYVDQYIVDIGKNYQQAAVSTDYYISDTESEKVFAKDLQTYDGTTLQYIGIMPKGDDLITYIKNVNAEKLSKIISEMKEVKYDNFEEGVITNIKGKIPLFKYEYELKLIEDLNELNIKDIFDINKADLSNMLKDEKQYIGDAQHKALIEFSNDGIKAAAVTTMGGMGAAAGGCGYQEYSFDVPVKKIDITFDKPYMYIIRDTDSGEVWFTGTVYEPTQNS